MRKILTSIAFLALIALPGAASAQVTSTGIVYGGLPGAFMSQYPMKGTTGPVIGQPVISPPDIRRGPGGTIDIYYHGGGTTADRAALLRTIGKKNVRIFGECLSSCAFVVLNDVPLSRVCVSNSNRPTLMVHASTPPNPGNPFNALSARAQTDADYARLPTRVKAVVGKGEEKWFIGSQAVSKKLGIPEC